MYYLVYPLFWLAGFMPRWAQRFKGWMLYLLLYRVLRYRVGVVRDNLSKAFKDKSEQELLDIERKFYRHLGDVFIDTLVMTSASSKRMLRRIEFTNAEQTEEFMAGRSWISAMAHYGSWELTTLWGEYAKKARTKAVYRPLHSKVFDRIFRDARSRFGVEPVAMENVGRVVYEANRSGEPVALAMIADQSALGHTGSYWCDFMGRLTPVFNGMERLALRYKMPVVFLNMSKDKRGNYSATFEVIYDGEEKVERGEIIVRYLEKLEAMIEQRPELWMWSHRRWKREWDAEQNMPNYIARRGDSLSVANKEKEA